MDGAGVLPRRLQFAVLDRAVLDWMLRPDEHAASHGKSKRSFIVPSLSLRYHVNEFPNPSALVVKC